MTPGSSVAFLILVAGLLSIPSTCTCGAEFVHAHSLFLLAGHHHALDGKIDDGFNQTARGSRLDRLATDSSSNQVVKGLVTEFAHGPIGLTASAHSVSGPPSAVDQIRQLSLSPSGRFDIPEPPPPRS